MTYSLWQLIGDHPILSVILLYIVFEGIKSVVEAWRETDGGD